MGFRKILLTVSLLLSAFITYAQVTTSSMTGTVKDDKGENLIGATVKATHLPSGTVYGTTTQADGRFTIPGMRVGGPYRMEVSYIGYEPQQQDGITLTLGQAYIINPVLTTSGQQLETITVTGSSREDRFNSNKTGAATNISRNTIQAIPNISRGLKDFTKLSPLANTNGNGTSFAGTNNRYNQFTIDGLMSNDVFGLAASGTNGGQTGVEPISLDAIEEFTINIAPYDVRQGGFTGGGINAVTRSGTNEFQGSVYYFGNNQDLVGSNNPQKNAKQKVSNYKDYQTGLRLGGPIIKNKLFFFVNGEITKRNTPIAYNPADLSSGSQITTGEINRILATLDRIAPNYDPGSYTNLADEIKSTKLLGKIDWNINQHHKLTLRHSYTKGESTSNSRTATLLRFGNNAVFFPSTTNASGLELNSTFGRFSNNLLIGYTKVDDDRDALGNPFPEVNIYLANGSRVVVGGEYSSVANQLKQDIWNITDNFNWYLGKHTLTLGTHNEFYKFYNLFIQRTYGQYYYNSLENFESIGTAAEVAPSAYQVGYPLNGDGAAAFSAMQLGFYAQDEAQLTDRLRVTAGLRIDLPIFNDKPPFNQEFADQYGHLGLSTDQIPSTKILWSPRLGFNWDVLGDNSLKIRGGTGIFTGRVPFVWISNQYSNNGTVTGTYSIGNTSSSANPITNPAGVEFVADPNNQPRAGDFGGREGLGAINITSKDFKFPQTFRTNLAVDKQLPWGLTATIEGIYSKGLNNVNFQNLNREVDPDFTFDGPDKRPYYKSGRLNPDFDEIIVFENTNKGYSYNVMAQLQKRFESGFTGSIAYTYGKSTDLNSGTSSVAYSNWRYVNQIYGLNDLRETTANFDIRHRISGFVSYRKEYAKYFATQVSLFYNGQIGLPYSYIYNGDLNNDGTSNDMIYVPRNQSEINLIPFTNSSGEIITPEQQWQMLDAYISNDKYLSEKRGEYAERNGARMPWEHQFDVRILQDFAIKTGASVNKLQLSFDILNVGNLLNKKWGRAYSIANQGFSLISYRGLNGNTPTYQYTGAGLIDGKPYSPVDLLSRWRAQFGVRYIFN